MFNIDWQELFVIGALAIIVLGPKELPRVLRTVMGLMRKARMVASEFHEAINDAARQADMEDVRKQLSESIQNPADAIRNTIDPDGELKQEIQSLSRLDDYVRDELSPTPAADGTPVPPPPALTPTLEPPRRSGENG